MRFLILLPLSLLFIACQSNSKKSSESASDSIAYVQDTASTSWKNEGCAWLKTNVEKNFTNDGRENMEAITTAEYYEYKSDATNVDLIVDGSLTADEFQKKWGNKFDTKYAGIGAGFRRLWL